jgi:hypothetical protein
MVVTLVNVSGTYSDSSHGPRRPLFALFSAVKKANAVDLARRAGKCVSGGTPVARRPPAQQKMRL